MYAGILMKENKRVLFIQYRVEATGCLVWVSERGEMRQLMSPKLRITNLEDVVDKLLQGRSDMFDICICDGMVADDVQGRNLRLLLINALELPDAKISKLILVTSFHLYIAHGQGNKTKTGNTQFMTFDSWQKEDFGKGGHVELGRG